MMARRMRRKSHVRCRAGEKVEIISNPYLLLYGSKIIRGCLAESTKEQKESHSTRDRVCTHTIVQAGSPEAKKSDKLILGNRTFYIIDLDEVGSLGISTIYYAEERKDVK